MASEEQELILSNSMTPTLRSVSNPSNPVMCVETGTVCSLPFGATPSTIDLGRSVSPSSPFRLVPARFSDTEASTTEESEIDLFLRSRPARSDDDAYAVPLYESEVESDKEVILVARLTSTLLNVSISVFSLHALHADGYYAGCQTLQGPSARG
jgi:hypothetical protein